MPATLNHPSTLKSRAVLVPISGVQMIAPMSYDLIRKLVVGGQSKTSDLFHPGFQWVWNFATRPDGERDLRFWRDEVEDAKAVTHLGLGEVLARILPLNRKAFHAGEVVEMFMLRRWSLAKLREQMGGRLETSGGFFTRDGIEHFLRNRWVGCHVPKQFSAKIGGPLTSGSPITKEKRRAVNPSPRDNARRAEGATTREASDSNLAGLGTPFHGGRS